MSEIKPFAFVLMPFHDSFDDIYKLGIKKTCEELGIVAERVDEQFYSENMLERIYRQIENADLIIADMTGKNPNVFYEVGYAHAKGKLCALITQRSEDIPFDLQQHFHVIYDGKIGLLAEELKLRLEWMKEEVEKRKTELLAVSIKAESGNLKATDYIHQGDFKLRVFIKNVSQKRSPEIDNISIIATKSWDLQCNGVECASEPHGEKLKKFHVPPANSRIAPNAISMTEVTFSRMLWSKWGGAEKRDSYSHKGNLTVEVATAEGSLSYEFDLNVEFDEIPF